MARTGLGLKAQHLAWPPVLVSIVGTVPTLYLAWLAVPDAIRLTKPVCAGLVSADVG